MLSASALEARKFGRVTASSLPMGRCEDCDRPWNADEPGWVSVVLVSTNGQVEPLLYCPEHAQQFDPTDPGVSQIES